MILALKILTGSSKITVPSFTWELPLMQTASKPETTVAKQRSASPEECGAAEYECLLSNQKISWRLQEIQIGSWRCYSMKYLWRNMMNSEWSNVPFLIVLTHFALIPQGVFLR